MTNETGRYLIDARLQGACYTAQQRQTRRFVALFTREVYQDFGEYHCTYRGGAIGLHIKPSGKKWICKEPDWIIERLEMISFEQYRQLIGVINDVPAKEHQERK